MKKIITSLGVIVAMVALVAGATTAFLSDTETSTGNTFAAGAIDLKIDNDSYYNGNRCTKVGEVWLWQGTADFPVPGTPCSTSWPLDDLSNGRLFFNFTDLKPDDEGEDTISLHAQNDAYMCMDMTLTTNDDKSSNEPELSSPDALEDADNTWDGELAQNLNMFWWADDGDNVYEVGENTISGGVKSLLNLAKTNGPFSVALADATHNVWNPNSPGPIPADRTMYIAKAWCFGTLTLNPVAAGQGQNPSVASGISCDGKNLNNETQTDGATLDVAFRAYQARHVPGFKCNEERPRTATITVTKVVVNDNGGNNIISDFQLFLDNGISAPIPVTSGVPSVVSVGNYVVTEEGVPGYQSSFSIDCNASGEVTLLEGDNKNCTITNDDLPANITLFKVVINNTNDGDTDFGPTSFGLRVDGAPVSHNSSVAVTPNTPHTINEIGRAGYSFVGPITGTSNYGKSCPAVLGGSITLDEGEAIVCTITNDDN